MNNNRHLKATSGEKRNAKNKRYILNKTNRTKIVKRLWCLIFVILFLMLYTIGNILAYFTDTKSKVNIFSIIAEYTLKTVMLSQNGIRRMMEVVLLMQMRHKLTTLDKLRYMRCGTRRLTT